MSGFASEFQIFARVALDTLMLEGMWMKGFLAYDLQAGCGSKLTRSRPRHNPKTIKNRQQKSKRKRTKQKKKKLQHEKKTNSKRHSPKPFASRAKRLTIMLQPLWKHWGAEGPPRKETKKKQKNNFHPHPHLRSRRDAALMVPWLASSCRAHALEAGPHRDSFQMLSALVTSQPTCFWQAP